MSECPPRSVLLVRPSALGDVCRSVPVLCAMREVWPDAHLGWLVQSEYVDAIRAHPALDEIIRFPRNQLRGAWKSPSKGRQLLSFLHFLRTGKWDMVVDCQGLARSAFFARMTGAPVRTGFSRADECAWIHYTNRVSVEETHAVDRMMGLMKPHVTSHAPDMRLYAPAPDVRWWNLNELRPSSYAVFAPKSRWASKEWPADRWLELARGFAEKRSTPIILIGSPGEREAVDDLAARMQLIGIDSHSLAGRASIGQTMAVIEKAAVVVANDSAPMHMAVGFDRPLVALFGPTDPAEVGPYGRSDAVLRPENSFGKGRDYRMPTDTSGSMSDIEVDSVLQKALAQIGGVA
ncbi:MAG: hypothetical protein CMJ33_07300 [Phycisphaerae bacterium]|nr:hypothetical protein [Phycisphaerae bacterium]